MDELACGLEMVECGLMEKKLYGLSSHQTMRLRGMSEAFQSATSNPSKYRGL